MIKKAIVPEIVTCNEDYRPYGNRPFAAGGAIKYWLRGWLHLVGILTICFGDMVGCAPEAPSTPNIGSQPSRDSPKIGGLSAGTGAPAPVPGPARLEQLNGSTAFNSTSTWTVPSGVTSIVVELWGGQGFPGKGGGMGGGGAYSKKTIAVQKGQVIQVVFSPDGGGRGASVRVGTTMAGGGQTGMDCSSYDDTPYLEPNGGNFLTAGEVGKGGMASGGDTNLNGSDGDCGKKGVSADPNGALEKKVNSKDWGAEAWITW